MHHAFLIGLNILVMAETVLTVCALAACLRAGAKNPVPAMRDYLIVRAANVVGVQIFLSWPGRSLLLSNETGHALMIFYFWYWSAALVLVLLEMRVAVGAMAVFFKDLPGLQGLFRLASRWIAIAGVIVVIPLILGIAVDFEGRTYLQLFRRWWYIFATVQLVPAVFPLLVGIIRKVRWNSRTIAILAGFVFEPVIHLAGPWVWTNNTWIVDVANIANELACCAAVALWTVCFLVPEAADSLAVPTPAMLRLNEMTRAAMRRRQPVAQATATEQKGAQPWPKYRRDT